MLNTIKLHAGTLRHTMAKGNKYVTKTRSFSFQTTLDNPGPRKQSENVKTYMAQSHVSHVGIFVASTRETPVGDIAFVHNAIIPLYKRTIVSSAIKRKFHMHCDETVLQISNIERSRRINGFQCNIPEEFS